MPFQQLSDRRISGQLFNGNRTPSNLSFKEYLEEGLRVTVNTDNPGISRTDFTSELHRAARLTPGGLSLWEILLLIRNSFKASFSGSDARHEMLRQAESEIIEFLKEGTPF